MISTLLLAVSLVVADAPRVVQVTLGPVQKAIVRAITQPQHRFVDVEGALRSAKTWSILIGIRRSLEDHPGIVWTMARWNKADLDQKLVPDWRNVCALMSVPHGRWNTLERCFDFANGSRLYAVALKASQAAQRYAHIRGLTTAGFYINQLEEVPEDVYDEAALRLSQPGFPQLMIVDPNPVPDTHWIAKMWPDDNRKPDHRYIRLAIWDNKHNLSPETIAAAERLYPEGHPRRRVKLEGKRGLAVHGKPVYVGAFNRTRHATQAVELHPDLPLGEAYDYGFHHPCVVWYQYAPWGWLRVLGGVMGSDLHLEHFLPIVERYRNLWFPQRVRIDATCDPAGAAQNSQGLRGTPVGMLQDWYREHGERDAKGAFVTPMFTPDANQPERRHAATELAATYMARQVNGAEAFLVDPERWVLVALGDERFDNFFIDGLDAGYVLEDEPRHSNRLGTYWVPKKDGWYEHAQNCFEYGVQAHVRDLPLSTQHADEALLKHDTHKERDRQRALRQQQRDVSERPSGRIRFQGRGRGRGRAGY